MERAKVSGVDERSAIVHVVPLHRAWLEPEVARRKVHIDSDVFMGSPPRTGFAMGFEALLPPGCDSMDVRFVSAALVHPNAPPLAV